MKHRLKSTAQPFFHRIARFGLRDELRNLEHMYRRASEIETRLNIHERYLEHTWSKNVASQSYKRPALKRRPLSLDESLRRLRAIAPAAYLEWRRVSENASKAYRGFPTHSCSVKGHMDAELFRLFILPDLNGTVLDVDCGPQPIPEYLHGYPLYMIHGIDPISTQDDHPFAFVQGVAEFLPWKDKQFDTVIVATSLDHVLLLDKALLEIRRVIKRGGYLFTWDAFIKGAKKYDPYQNEVVAVDEFHLFHFDDWFESAVKPLFEIDEIYTLPANGSNRTRFYKLRARRALGATSMTAPARC